MQKSENKTLEKLKFLGQCKVRCEENVEVKHMIKTLLYISIVQCKLT